MRSWKRNRSWLVGGLMLPSLLVVLIGVAAVTNSRSQAQQGIVKEPKISLRANGQGWPRLTFQDAASDVDLATVSDPMCQSSLAQFSSEVAALPRDTVVDAVPESFGRGDFNEDGIADLLVVGSGHLSIQFGLRTGAFCRAISFDLGISAPIGPAVDDFNLDGHLDVALASANAKTGSLLVGNGRGGFDAIKSFETGKNVRALLGGDFNRDGRADLAVVAASPARVGILEGRGQDGFASPEVSSLATINGEPIAARAFDMDRNGALDLAVAYGGDAHGVAVMFGSREQGFGEPVVLALPEGTSPADLAVADFNFDQQADVAVTGGENVYVFLGQSGQKFSNSAVISVGGAATTLAVGQFDNDGHPDLAVSLTSSNTVAILLGDGRGSFEPPVDLDVDSEPVALMSDRLNRDALSDLVIGKRRGGGTVTALTGPNPIVVNTTADNLTVDNNTTLREAILAAEITPGPDVITFNIPASQAVDGIYTIRVDGSLGGLPALRDGGTTINGASQPGFNFTPIVVLNGANAGLVDGLVLNSSLNVVAGLVINGFQGSGVKIIVDPPESTTTTGNIVRGCYIGTDATGKTAVGNGLFGVLITRNRTQANLIGGTATADRNVISGNKANGVELNFPTFDNIIAGNYIGTTADGISPLPNGGTGVFISGARDNIVGGKEAGAGNLISGNLGSGVEIIGVSGNQVLGNLIGTDFLGTKAVPNATDGVSISGEARNNTIGGLTVSSRNVISGNAHNGIKFTLAIANQVIGNSIGTNITGANPLANGSSGILITFGSQNNIIGGAEPGGNVIAGNTGDGITIAGGAVNTLVLGNYIGTTDRAGSTQLPNGGHGVNITGASNNNIGSGNTIAYNNQAGVVVLNSESASSQGNRIACNSIFANRGLGIDLNGDGVTPNDSRDTDSGPNRLMNYPVITGVSDMGGGSSRITGRLDTVNPSVVEITVYIADADPSGFGEGRTCLAEGVRPRLDGTFDTTVVGVPAGAKFTLTATDDGGNTSEFSGAAPPVDTTGPNVRVITPNGGETVIAGSILPIAWEASDPSGIVSQELRLSIDGGATCAVAIARVAGDVRAFNWLVPESLTTLTARICVTAVDFFDNPTTDQSDRNFAIIPPDREGPAVRVIRPNGGETVASGQTTQIVWEAFDNVGVASCDLFYSIDSGATFNAIVLRLPGDVRTYDWAVPAGITSTRGRVRVLCRDAAGNTGQDNSDFDFAFDSQSPVIGDLGLFDAIFGIAPLPGATAFLNRQTMLIIWRASDDVAISSFKIELSRDGGRTYEPLRDGSGNVVGDNLPGTAREFRWLIPVGYSINDGRIRVTATDRVGRIGQVVSHRIFILNSTGP